MLPMLQYFQEPQSEHVTRPRGGNAELHSGLSGQNVAKQKNYGGIKKRKLCHRQGELLEDWREVFTTPLNVCRLSSRTGSWISPWRMSCSQMLWGIKVNSTHSSFKIDWSGQVTRECSLLMSSIMFVRCVQVPKQINIKEELQKYTESLGAGRGRGRGRGLSIIMERWMK